MCYCLRNSHCSIPFKIGFPCLRKLYSPVTVVRVRRKWPCFGVPYVDQSRCIQSWFSLCLTLLTVSRLYERSFTSLCQRSNGILMTAKEFECVCANMSWNNLIPVNTTKPYLSQNVAIFCMSPSRVLKYYYPTSKTCTLFLLVFLS